MAQKITITLPDELFKDLQTVKDQFNISGVCRVAIEREVERQKLSLKGEKEMSAIVARLKEEKQDYDKQYEDEGYKQGYEDAKKMGYEELVEFANSNSWDYWRTEAWDKWQDDVNDQISELSIDDPNVNKDAYCNGWAKGVAAFYEDVKDQL